MTFVVTSNCERCRFTDCVEACPVDCFHGDATMLYIDPDECIECGACVPQCPVEAIFLDRHIPSRELYWVAENRRRAPLLPVIACRQEPLPGARARAQGLGFSGAREHLTDT